MNVIIGMPVNAGELLQIIEHEYPRLLSQAISIVKNRQDAEDALQNAFVKAWLHCADLRSTKKCRAWLSQIIRNECISLLRAQSKNEILTDDDVADNLPRDRSFSSDPQLEEVVESIAHLPERYATLVNLYYLEGHSTESISSQIGISQGTVKSRLFYARKYLRNEYERAYSAQ